jgi:hypothetical protein
MRGVVAKVSDGRVAAVSLMAGYSVIQVTDDKEVREGDIVNGDLERVGYQRTVKNETTGEEVEISIKDYCHSLAQATKRLHL